MALEWTMMWELEPAIPMTCDEATGIEKGALLKLADPFTAIIASGSADPIAGIAAEEKIANDGKTTIAVYMRGIFKAQCGATINVGECIMAEGTTPNEIIKLTAAGDGADGCGIALETGSVGQTILVLLNVGTGGGAET